MDLSPLVDTHAHLTASEYDEDREEITHRAQRAGLIAIITVGFEPGDWQNTLNLAEQHPIIYAALGIHPNSADQATEDAMTRLYELICGRRSTASSQQLVANIQQTTDQSAIRNPQSAIRGKPVVALGETGLDYYREHVSHEVQRSAFRAHLDLARQLDLPVIIHNRDAHSDILAILERDGKGTRGVMHSASGDLDFARRALALDYMISLSGPVTFKKAADKHALATQTPLDMLMVETDCPYLTPEPHRGRRNEPAYVKYTAQSVATLRDLPYGEVARATTENASRLFNLPVDNEQRPVVSSQRQPATSHQPPITLRSALRTPNSEGAAL